MFLRTLLSLEKQEPDVLAGFVLPPAQITSPRRWRELQVKLLENCWQSQVSGLDLRFIRNGNGTPVVLLLCRIMRPVTLSRTLFRDYCLEKLYYVHQLLVDAGYAPLPIVEAQGLERALQPFPFQVLAEIRRSEDEHTFNNGEHLIHFYMPSPWEWELQDEWPLAEILAQQPGEWLVSVLLQPTPLMIEEQQILERVTSSPLADLLNNSGRSGRTLYQYYELFAHKLQRPFLLRTTLAASNRATLDNLSSTLLRYLHVSGQRPILQLPNSHAALQSLNHLAWIPWGNRRDGDLKTGRLRYLVDSQGASNVFQLPSSVLKPRDRKIHILFIYADTGAKNLHLGTDARIIEEILQRCKYRENIVLDFCPAARARDLRFKLLNSEKDFHIIHIASHGLQAGLLFEQDGSDEGKLATFETLAEYLGIYGQEHKSLRCVLVTACHTERFGQLLVTQRPEENQIPYAITMDGLADNFAAREFTRGFYERLGADRALKDGQGEINIEKAGREGRLSAEMEEPSVQLQPLLFIKGTREPRIP